MPSSLRQKIENVNLRIAQQLENARRALRGQAVFAVDEVRRLRAPLDEMQPIVAQSSALREQDPEISEPLTHYKSQLTDLQIVLNQLHIMLLARQASLHAGQSQLAAVHQWMNAFRQTR